VPTLFARFSRSAVPGDVRLQLESLLASWKAKRADGRFSVFEFIDFSREFVGSAMYVVKGLNDDAVKKALVLEAAGLLYDHFAPVILVALPWYLKWLAFLFQAGAKEQFLNAVTVLIEVIYNADFKPAA
jgi:hypothetical protein